MVGKEGRKQKTNLFHILQGHESRFSVEAAAMPGGMQIRP